MLTINDKQTTDSPSQDEVGSGELPSSRLSPESHDADTPSVIVDGKKESVRIDKVGGTEIDKGVTGFGKNVLRLTGVELPKEGSDQAEFFKKGLYGIFGDSATEVESSGTGKFGRTLGNLKVEGMDWRHMMYELGVSDRWTNYGYDTKGSAEDEKFKWYGGKSQATNIDAYVLLEEAPEPRSILDDETYNRINQLRASAMSHMDDANKGVVMKDEAKAVFKELMHDPDALALAQKRRWYEKTRNSDIGKMMLADWNVPMIRSEIEEQSRVAGKDVSPRVDTSYTGIITNALKQQYGDLERYQMGTRTGSHREGTFKETFEKSEVDEYIANNDISPDVAAKMYEAMDNGDTVAAIDVGDFERIHAETKAVDEKLTREKGIAKQLVFAAAPYAVDVTTYMGGGASGAVAKKVAEKAFVKVTSPIMRKAMTGGVVGAGAGFGESVAFTSNNYQEFTNEQLLTTWATDTGMGFAFGNIFAVGAHGLNKYGAKAKQRSAGEGLEDLDIPMRPREPAEPEFKADTKAAETRLDEMQDEVATQLQRGEGDSPVADVDVPEVEPMAKPEPEVATTPEGETTSKSTPDESPVDTRTPEQIEVDEAKWQADSVDLALDHQMSTVQPALEKINKGQNWLSKVHKALGNSVGMQEFASRLIFNADKKMSFIGTHILESGIGFTGKMKRKASAALIKDSHYTKHVGNLNKSYVDNVSAWAMEQGSDTYRAFKAAWEGGKVNSVAREFHKAVFRHQEMLQMGMTPEPNKYIEDYVKSLNKVNDELFDGRVSANVKGFNKERRIGNYIPHVWKKVKVNEITKRHGENVVLELLTKSIESAKRAGKIADSASTTELAERQLNWINGLGDSMEHTGEVGAGISGRGKSRIPLDFTTEHNGLSMLDLIDTDVPSVMDSYIQRAGADIGISEATNGLIRSEGDFVKFLTPDSDADKLLVQDAMDMLYGRPTRQGMSPEMRSMMDIVTVQQMGGIGVAQLAETGTMAQRLVVNYMSQPKVAKKIWAMAGESMDDRGVMAQVRSISAVNDNMEYINRYSVNNIDQAQIDELSNLRAASIDAVDKATLGSYKAQFGRMLGSLSGVNAIQKAQSRLLQASFSVDIARAAKFNKGTSTGARLNDLGLTADGKAFANIRKHVEFDEDGFPSNFNFDSWDKDALDEFVYAMNREEAQLMPRVMAGELPVFMNKPMWQVIMQFRKTPLAFMSKGAQRNLQFADREAVLGTVLNSMTAGVTRYSKFALAGGGYAALTDEEFRQPTMNQMQPWNYVSNFGIMGDAYTIGQSWSKTAQSKSGIEALWEGATQVSVLSSIDSAYNAVQGDPVAIKRSMPLNTLPLVNEVSNAVIKNMEQ